MVRGAEVVVASDLFYIDCGSGLSKAGWVIVNGLNWCLQGVLLVRISQMVKSEWLWGQWIHTWMPCPSHFIQCSVMAWVITHQSS